MFQHSSPCEPRAVLASHLADQTAAPNCARDWAAARERGAPVNARAFAVAARALRGVRDGAPRDERMPTDGAAAATEVADAEDASAARAASAEDYCGAFLGAILVAAVTAARADGGAHARVLDYEELIDRRHESGDDVDGAGSSVARAFVAVVAPWLRVEKSVIAALNVPLDASSRVGGSDANGGGDGRRIAAVARFDAKGSTAMGDVAFDAAADARVKAAKIALEPAASSAAARHMDKPYAALRQIADETRVHAPS